jgi:hypothetical protein
MGKTISKMNSGKSLLYRFSPEIIIFIYILLFLVIKNPNNPFDRVIMSDGKAYYAYLTNFFIYHDPEYKFVENYEKKYYAGDELVFKEFRLKYDGKTLIKGFPGLAFLFLPFFLMAHLLSLLLGFTADGYSIIYQYSMGFAAIFYLWAGLKYLKGNLLALGFSKQLATAIIFIIAFGTNIIYYTIKEGTMVHVYNFALIAAFLYFLKKSIVDTSSKPLILTAFIYGLIVVARPTDGLVMLLLPFIAGNAPNLKRFLRNVLFNPAKLLFVLAAGSVFPFLTILIWYWQTGHWFIYSYGKEGFDFLNPHFFQILFSFNKGWFVYTPIALVAMTGYVYLYQKNRYQFFWGVLIIVLFVYVASSWWAWHYTSNFGQRIFIDIYAWVAILLGYAYSLVRKHKTLKVASIAGVILLIGMNGLQFYQHYTYIFPPGTINSKQYKDSFFRLVPAPKVDFPREKVERCDVLMNDFEKDYGWLNYASVTDTLAFEGKFSSQAGLVNEYSIGLYEPLRKHLSTDFGWVKVSCEIFSNQKYSQARMVFDVESEGKSIFYKPFYLRDVNRMNKWAYIEYGIKLPKLRTQDDMLRVYFINSDANEFFLVDNLKVEILSLKEEFEFY